jgi:hypothetical protein
MTGGPDWPGAAVIRMTARVPLRTESFTEQKTPFSGLRRTPDEWINTIHNQLLISALGR